MPAIVICNVSRGHKTSKTQCLHILGVEIGPPMPKTHMKMRRCYVDLMFCAGGTFFVKSIETFYKIWWFFVKVVKSMPAIVIATASRGHKTWKTSCLHRLCVEIGPPMPKTYFKMRRCYSDLMFCSGGTFFLKSMENFIKFIKSMPAIVISTASPGHKT